MKWIWRGVISLFFLILLALPALAFTPGGTKALGMGGAFTAVADDASCVFWNPAGLIRTELFVPKVSLSVSGEKADGFIDFYYFLEAIGKGDNAAAEEIAQRISTPMTFDPTIDMPIADIGVGFVDRLAITGCAQGEVSLDTFEYDPGTHVEFKYTGTALAPVYLTFARKSSRRPLVLGGNVKYYMEGLRYRYHFLQEDGDDPVITEERSELKQPVFSFDLGLLYELAKGKVSLGIMAENLLGEEKIEFPDMTEESLKSLSFSRKVNVGIALRPSSWFTLAADMHNAFTEESTSHYGGELKLPSLTLWAGLDDNIPTYGIRLKILLLALPFDLEAAYRSGDNPSVSLVLLRVLK